MLGSGNVRLACSLTPFEWRLPSPLYAAPAPSLIHCHGCFAPASPSLYSCSKSHITQKNHLAICTLQLSTGVSCCCSAAAHSTDSKSSVSFRCSSSRIACIPQARGPSAVAAVALRALLAQPLLALLLKAAGRLQCNDACGRHWHLLRRRHQLRQTRRRRRRRHHSRRHEQQC